jgi:hypothetical protein
VTWLICQFINPVLSHDTLDPYNRTKWHAQQWRMTSLEPPHVYHVLAHDLDGLREAVEAALANPITSWIPEYMRFDYVCERTASMIEHDWRSVAAGILAQRNITGEGELFDL